MRYFGGCIYILAVKEWVFHLGLAFLRSCFVLLYYLFLLPCVSLCFLLLVDVFQFARWSNLQAAVPRDDLELRSFADSLPDVAFAGRALSTATKYSATYARWKRWAHAQGLPAVPASPYHFVSLASLDGGSQGRCSHRVCRSCHCLGSPFGWGAISLGVPAREGCSCWCLESFGPPYVQKGTYYRCSIGTISSL